MTRLLALATLSVMFWPDIAVGLYRRYRKGRK